MRICYRPFIFHDLGSVQKRNDALEVVAAAYQHSGDPLRYTFVCLYQLHLNSVRDAQTTIVKLNQCVCHLKLLHCMPGKVVPKH